MRIEFSAGAKKDLLGLDEETRNRILRALKQLQDNPQAADLRKLKGAANHWRLRVGDYRILIKIEWRRGIALLEGIFHRKDAYR